MHMKNNPEFIDMMRGYFGEFDQYELWTILCHQNELGINTISIQKMSCGKFICKVDKLSVEAYKKKDNKE